MIANGSVFKFGDNIDTDVIIPARYLNIADYKELATHCMEDIDDKFISKVKKGDIIVATKNFGCGSSREHAPIVIKESGVSCVIANNIDEGDNIEVDFSTGVIKNITKGKEYKAEPFPEFMQNIILNEGLINSIKANRG